MKKTQFENYYERKLHDEREGHKALENKLLMGAIGQKLQAGFSGTAKAGGAAQQANSQNSSFAGQFAKT